MEETIRLANDGDIESIWKLGLLYYNGDDNYEKDYDESLKWFIKGAEYGNVDCMYMASLLGGMNGRVTRKIGGATGATLAIEELKTALYWAEQALANGKTIAKEQIDRINCELGIAYYLVSVSIETDDTVVEYLEKAIAYLKPVYSKTADNEVLIYLAFALHKYGSLNGYNKENDILEFELLRKCVDEHFGQLIHTDIAACYLGLMFMEGRGCEVDHDNAMHYFQMAHNAGFDCSDFISELEKETSDKHTSNEQISSEESDKKEYEEKMRGLTTTVKELRESLITWLIAAAVVVFLFLMFPTEFKSPLCIIACGIVCIAVVTKSYKLYCGVKNIKTMKKRYICEDESEKTEKDATTSERRYVTVEDAETNIRYDDMLQEFEAEVEDRRKSIIIWLIATAIGLILVLIFRNAITIVIAGIVLFIVLINYCKLHIGLKNVELEKKWMQIVDGTSSEKPWVGIKHRHENRLITRVHNTHAQELLSLIALETNSVDICCAAIENIHDQNTLKKLAGNTAYRVRAAVAEKISDKAVIEQLALCDESAYVRSVAVERVTDTEVLNRIAKKDSDSSVRCSAFFRVATSDELKEYFIHAEDLKHKDKLIRIKGESNLMEIALLASKSDIRIAAIEFLSTEKPEVKLLRSAANLSKSITAIEVYNFDKAYAEVKISNPQFLKRVAEVYPDTGVRYLARGRQDVEHKESSGFENSLKSWTPSKEELRKRDEIHHCDELIKRSSVCVSNFKQYCIDCNSRGERCAECDYGPDAWTLYSHFENYSDAVDLAKLIEIKLKDSDFLRAVVCTKKRYDRVREWQNGEYVNVERFRGYVVNVSTSW